MSFHISQLPSRFEVLYTSKKDLITPELSEYDTNIQINIETDCINYSPYHVNLFFLVLGCILVRQSKKPYWVKYQRGEKLWKNQVTRDTYL